MEDGRWKMVGRALLARDKSCHSERSEESLAAMRKTLNHFAHSPLSDISFLAGLFSLRRAIYDGLTSK
ncbi:MAG: hypothetical protein LBL66_05065, partial [Clostridiales bacterium]|nr:hypothetical protein [Clostridiales bacterium]